MTPNQGTTAGGTHITISGNNFKELYCEEETVTLNECETALSYCSGGICSNTDFLTEQECISNGECQESGTCADDLMITT